MRRLRQRNPQALGVVAVESQRGNESRTLNLGLGYTGDVLVNNLGIMVLK